jgi:tetratricopeptide (TPR) repeat protein
VPQNSLRKPATDKLTELRRLRREQEQRVQKIQRLTVEVVADFRRSGDALYMQYRFTDALASYEKALVEIDREDAPALWAGTLVDVGRAHAQLAAHVQAFEAIERLRSAINAYCRALEVYTREQWALTQTNLGLALAEQGVQSEGAQATELLAQAVAASSDGEAKAKPEVIKLGLDLHARQVTECGSTPKPAQKWDLWNRTSTLPRLGGKSSTCLRFKGRLFSPGNSDDDRSFVVSSSI